VKHILLYIYEAWIYDILDVNTLLHRDGKIRGLSWNLNLVEEQHEIDAESEHQCDVFQIVKISCQEGYHTMTVFR